MDKSYYIKSINNLLNEFDIEEVKALNEILRELKRAIYTHPAWPTDPIHAAAIVSEEAGELIRASLHEVYDVNIATQSRMINEAVQTGATALRFIAHEEHYLRGDEVTKNIAMVFTENNDLPECRVENNNELHSDKYIRMIHSINNQLTTSKP